MALMSRRMDYMPVIVWAVLLEKLNLYFLIVSELCGLCMGDIAMVTVVILEPLLNTTEATEYLQKNVNPVLLRGLTQLCKEKPVDPIVRATVQLQLKILSGWYINISVHDQSNYLYSTVLVRGGYH